MGVRRERVRQRTGVVCGGGGEKVRAGKVAK